MTVSKPLQGVELVDCAAENAKAGIDEAARLCGYGEDLETFWQNLHAAGEEMGVPIEEMSDCQASPSHGVEITPDRNSSL